MIQESYIKLRTSRACKLQNVFLKAACYKGERERERGGGRESESPNCCKQGFQHLGGVCTSGKFVLVRELVVHVYRNVNYAPIYPTLIDQSDELAMT